MPPKKKPTKQENPVASATTPEPKKVDFIDQPTATTQCEQCEGVAIGAHTTDCCVKLLCEQCLPKDAKKCPSCGVAPVASYADKRAQRDVNEMKVRCPNTPYGCTWTDALKNLGAHECGKTLIPCKFADHGCPVQVAREAMPGHMEKFAAEHVEILHAKVDEREQKVVELEEELRATKSQLRTKEDVLMSSEWTPVRADLSTTALAIVRMTGVPGVEWRILFTDTHVMVWEYAPPQDRRVDTQTTCRIEIRIEGQANVELKNVVLEKYILCVSRINTLVSSGQVKLHITNLLMK